ncbi:hypothetical protein [Maridesulfovibrio sp. FT414]|uniref:hypothetical protein n=1 Tax=Maridesulfovibrio sp. FT414 TaxID=2979469 RepID=UPI003D805364
MRISRYGGQQFQSGGGGASERSAKFRKKFKAGEVIQGILLKWEQPKLGWVQIDDLLLLANVMTSPMIGDVLTFVVQQLYPDIILKEVGPDDFNSMGEYINPTDVTRTFVRCRSAFQSRGRDLLELLSEGGGLDASGRLNRMLDLFRAEPEIGALFFETLKAAADLNSILKASRLYYMPWLIPSGLNHEIVLKIKEPTNREGSFYELLFAVDLPPAVPVRLRMMYRKPQCGFKLLADDRNLGTLLGVNFKHAFSEFLGVERIPQQCAGGFLAELLSG